MLSLYVILKGTLNGNTYAGAIDLCLLQYNSAGTMQWTQLAGTTSADFGYGVSLSSDTLSVYVIGYTSGSMNGQINQGASDILLLKYSSSGVLQWTRQAGFCNSIYFSNILF